MFFETLARVDACSVVLEGHVIFVQVWPAIIQFLVRFSPFTLLNNICPFILKPYTLFYFILTVVRWELLKLSIATISRNSILFYHATHKKVNITTIEDGICSSMIVKG